MTTERTIVFPCPHCGANLSAKQEVAGKEASCPKCQKALVVPTEAEDAATRQAKD